MEPSVVKLTPEMLDSMKTAVVCFLGVQALLALFCVLWVVFVDNVIYRVVGPATLFTYSTFVLFTLRGIWRNFAIKMALLN